MPNLTMYGWAESTAAMRGILGRAQRAVGARRRRRASKATKRASSSRKRRTKRAAGKAAKFVKGSAAAKRHMAKLRKLAAKARRG